MLPDEANMQKQKKREEQLRKWREREMSESSSTIESFDKAQRLSMPKKETKVKFPKGCVFLAACSSGDIDEVRQQLKIGVNINTTNIDGLTALHQACIDANLSMVQFLVEHDADLNAQDNEGWTPLHAAVSVGNLEVVKFLVLMGARLDVCNSDSDLPIDLCDAGNVQMREYLEEEMRRRDIDADLEKRREEALMYEDAKEANFFDKVHNKTGATALHVSAAKGYLRVIKLLLQYNANVNEVDKDGWTPLHAAAHWEQEEACKLLIENGASLDIKNYAGQTPLDVCDKEMSVKLKALQQQLIGTNSIQKEKLNELNQYNNNNSNSKLDARVRRVSDELNKSSSITRLTNDAKSSLSEREKKQEKILLSPITTSITKPQFDIFANSDSETDKAHKQVNMETEEHMDTSSAISDSNHLKSNDDRFTFDKENINRSNSYTNSNSLTSSQGNAATTTAINSNNLVTDQETKVLNKSNSLNKPKTGLQESLKTLSAQVKLKMDEDEINDKNISLKPSSSNGDLSTTATSNFQSNNNSNTTSSMPTSSSSTSNLSSPTNTNLNSSLVNACSTSNGTTVARPYTDRRWGNTTGQGESSTYRRRIGGVVGTPNQASPLGSPLGGGGNSADLQNPLSPNGENSRRYSTAPIASKDEQAELIRKQKAKLERHFRRSTQAVSYEDIKSAEATIKGTGGSNPTTPTSVTSPLAASEQTTTTSGVSAGGGGGGGANSDLNGPIPPASTTSTTTFNFNTTPSPTTAQQNPQILTTVPINSPPISQQGVSNLTSLFGELITKNASSSNLYNLGQSSSSSNTQQQPSTTAESTTTSIATTPTPAAAAAASTAATTTTTTSGVSGEKDAIIAKDIETEKLLNEIEKSKGFSDSYSTQATRRLRNRAIPFFPQSSNNSTPSSSSSSSSAVFNSNYTDRFKPKSNDDNRDDENKSADRLSVQQSPNSQIKRINSGSSLDSNNALSIDVNNPQTMTTTSSTRPMYRFGQNESNSGLSSTGGSLAYLNNTGSGSSNSLRSTTTSTTTTTPSTNTNSNSSAAAIKRSVSQVPSSDRRALTTNGSTGGSNSTTAISDFSNSNVDFQTAYELMKKENELLNQTILRLQKELDEQNKLDGAGGLDKRERRALDRKISELEEEVKKVDNLKQDNNRLKEENAALIRVISKLSK